MASLGTAFVEIRPDTKGFKSILSRQVDGDMASFAQKGRTAFTAISRAATGAGLAVGLIGAASIRASIQFESAFAGVIKTVDATDAQLADLRTGILGMSTELPASANEISKVAEAAGQLGIQTENILGFSRVMVDLGETTNLSADQAATALARLANITQLPQDQFDRLGAAVVDLGNKGASTEAEIVEMGLRIAGAGEQIGLTEAEILGFANALSSLGLEVEAGGTAISRVFVELANSVALGGEQLETFASIAGQSASDFQQSFETDAAGAVTAFIEGLGRIEEEGGNVFAVLEDLGLADVRVRDALLRTANAEGLLAESIGVANTAWQENTALTEEAAKRYDTTAAQLEITRNKLTAAGIALGDGFLPFIREANEALDPFLDGIVELGTKVGKAFDRVAKGSGIFDDLGTSFQGFVDDISVKDIANAFENIGDAIDDLMPLIKAVGPAFALMGAQSIPVLGGLVPAFNPVIAVLGSLVLSSDEGRDALVSIGESVGPLVASLSNFASEGLGAVADGIAVLAPLITSVVVPALDLLAGAFGAAGEQAGIAGPLVGAALGFAVGGPWGAAIGGAIGLLGELAGAMGATGDATNEMRDYQLGLEDAIRGVTGAMLEQEGVFSEVASMRAIRQEFLDAGEAGEEAIRVLDGVGIGIQDFQAAITGGPATIGRFKQELSDLTSISTLTADEQRELWATIGPILDSYEGAARAAETYANAQDDVAFFTNRATEQQWGLLAAIQTNDWGQVIGPMGDLADTTANIAENTWDLTGSIEGATQASFPFIESLVGSANQMGLAGQAAYSYVGDLFEIPAERFTGVTNTGDAARIIIEELLKKYGAIPSEESTTVTTPGAAEAAGALDGVANAASRIPRQIDVSVNYKSQGQGLPGAGPAGYAQGGLALGGTVGMVGEKGPEIVYFPQDTRVIPAHETSRILSGGGMPAGLGAQSGGYSLDARDFRQGVAEMRAVMHRMLAALEDFADADGQTPFGSRV